MGERVSTFDAHDDELRIVADLAEAGCQEPNKRELAWRRYELVPCEECFGCRAARVSGLPYSILVDG